jgi:outer membrane autotransporter protein
MGVPGVAFADYRAQLWGTIAELGYYIPVGDGRIVPKIGVDWQRTEADGFTETGIPNPVTVAAQSSWRVRGLVGVEAGHTWASHTAVFDLSAYARAVEILDQQLPAAVVTGGGAPPATFQGFGESRFGVDAGASASLRFTEAIRLYALYDGRFRRNFTSHGGTVGLDVRF